MAPLDEVLELVSRRKPRAPPAGDAVARFLVRLKLDRRSRHTRSGRARTGTPRTPADAIRAPAEGSPPGSIAWRLWPADPAGRTARVGALAVFLFLCSLSIQKIWAADIWWQIRTGEWIAQHWTVPTVDTFSYTAAGHEWIEMRWLFCLAAWMLWRAGGPSALILAQTAVLAAAWSIVAWPLRRSATTVSGLIVLAAGIFSAASRYVFRPELVSYVCIGIYLVVLDGYTRGKLRRSVWALPAIQIVWTNAHTVFAFGPALVWLFFAGDAVRRSLVRAGIISPAMGDLEERGSSGRVDRDHSTADESGRDGARRSAQDTEGIFPGEDRENPTTRQPKRTGSPTSIRKEGGAAGGAQGRQSALRLFNSRLAFAGLLVTAACLINPYGLRGALFPITLFREIHKGSILGQTIKEFISPFALGHWSWDLYGAVALVFATTATFALNWRRIDPARLAVWVAFLYLAGVSLRNVAPLAFVSVWAALRNLEDLLPGALPGLAISAGSEPAAGTRSPRAERVESASSGHGIPALVTDSGRVLVEGSPGAERAVSASTRLSVPALSSFDRSTDTRWKLAGHAAFAVLLLFACWYVVSDHFYVRMGAPRRFGFGIVEWNSPGPAVAFLLRARPKTQVFSSLADGSYMTWWAKDQYPVYTDGRLEVYGEEFYTRYLALKGGDWERFADSQGVNIAVIERQYFGWETVGIAASPHWALVHMDPRDLVFIKEIPEHAEIIRKYRIDPKQPWTPRAAEPDERPSGWRRWIGSVETPWYCESMARNFLALGSAPNAMHFLELGVERFPSHKGIRTLRDKVRQHIAGGRGTDATAESSTSQSEARP